MSEKAQVGEPAKKRMKLAIFAILAAFLVFGNFYFENTNSHADSVVLSEFGGFSYEVDNKIGENGILRFDGKDSTKMTVIAASDDAYVFNLDEGGVWGNFELSDSHVNIKVGDAVFIPDHANFDLQFDGKRVNLSVFRGDVYLGILNENFQLIDYIDEYSELYKNRLLVPQGTQINFAVNKEIDHRILYSKLVKELKYTAIPSSRRESDWVNLNTVKDKKNTESVRQLEVSNILSSHVAVKSTSFGNALFWAERNLTFVPDKRESILLESLFSYLDDAIYFATQGDKEKSVLRMDEFLNRLTILPEDIKTSPEFINRFDSYISRLSLFEPNDEKYAILAQLLERKFMDKRGAYDVISAYWSDVYKGMSIGTHEAYNALKAYYNYFDRTVGDISDKEFYKYYVTYNNQLFDNLFLRYDVFYKDEYFGMKNALEQSLLRIYEQGSLKDELRQALISNKIDFLKRLRRYFFDGEMDVDSTKKILSRLIAEVDDLMPSDTTAVAVTEFFEKQLDDIGNFWGYLNTPMYNSSQTYGLTHEERYAAYLDEKDRIWSFVNIQEDVLGENVQKQTVRDVKKEIKAIFDADENISDFDLGGVNSVDQRNVDVKGVIGGYAFSAVFDRERETLNEITSYGEKISDSPIKLASLLQLLNDKFANSDVELVGDLELTQETIAERVARGFVAEKVSAVGFEATIENVKPIDTINTLYRVENVVLPDYESVRATFDFSMNGEKVTALLLAVSNKPVVIEGEYTLEEVIELVVAEYELLK